MPIILDGTTGITTPGITNTGTFVFQGPVQVPAGSAATASITTAAGANTGIFFPSSSSVAITTAGTQRFVVSAAGNVGIGTATPTTVLNYTFATINGSTGAGISLFNSNSDAAWIYATSAGLSISTETASPILFKINAATRATLDASGNLGIGTSSPTDTGGFGRVVDVQGSTGAQVVCRDSDDTTKFARLSFDGGTTNVASIGVEGADTQVAFRAGGGEKMRLTASGNLGLGVTPSAWSLGKAIEVGNPGNSIFGVAASQLTITQNAYFNAAYKYGSSAEASRYDQAAGQHIWFTAPSGTAGNNITFRQAMTLSTNTDRSTLNINGVSQALLEFSHNGTRKFYIYQVDSDTSITNETANGNLVFGTNSVERARITSGGQFCIGTTGTAGDARLRVVNEDNTSGDFLIVGQMGGNAINTSSYQYIGGNYAGSDNVYIYGNGNIVNTNNSYGTLSDVKLKQDIIDAASQWDDVKAFKFRKFRFKEEVSRNPNAPHQLGLIAQELEQTSPGLVDTTPDRQKEGETMKTIKTSVLLMKATKALQEAMARIEVLEADMAVLKGSN